MLSSVLLTATCLRVIVHVVVAVVFMLILLLFLWWVVVVVPVAHLVVVVSYCCYSVVIVVVDILFCCVSHSLLFIFLLPFLLFSLSLLTFPLDALFCSSFSIFFFTVRRTSSCCVNVLELLCCLRNVHGHLSRLSPDCLFTLAIFGL